MKKFDSNRSIRMGSNRFSIRFEYFDTPTQNHLNTGGLIRSFTSKRYEKTWFASDVRLLWPSQLFRTLPHVQSKQRRRESCSPALQFPKLPFSWFAISFILFVGASGFDPTPRLASRARGLAPSSPGSQRPRQCQKRQATSSSSQIPITLSYFTINLILSSSCFSQNLERERIQENEEWRMKEWDWGILSLLMWFSPFVIFKLLGRFSPCK